MKTDHSKFWGRVIPLYILVALPVAFLGPLYFGVTGPVFIVAYVINWVWMVILLRLINPFKAESAPHR